jgi:hypothetical protein
MIRNVVVGRLRAGVPVEAIEPALQAMRDLQVDGVEISVVAGSDLGLRDGNASYSLTVDIPDEEGYRLYDISAEHNRIRSELFGPYIESVERVQFRLPD